MSFQRCRREHTSREFIDWIVWLDEQEEKVSRDQYYLAQIATEVRKGNVKNPNRVRLKHLLLEFKKAPGKSTKKNTKKLSKEERTARSKAFWFALCDFKPKE